MTSGKLEKMEKDYSAEVDELLPETERLTMNGQLDAAIDALMAMEKQTRNSGDLASTSRILSQVVKACHYAKDWKRLNESVIVLSKKHGQLKQAVATMVREAMSFLDTTPDEATKLELIATLRNVTEGKIYVEVERAHLTRELAKMKENAGLISEAADILQELQVETYGSMDKREKTDFILEQMRLCLLNKDYIRTIIISKKINPSFFKNNENDDLKLRYYQLLIDYSLHENEYLNICKYYRELYTIQAIQDDEERKKETLTQAILFCLLSPYDHEQSDLLFRIMADKFLTQLDVIYDVAKEFTISQLIRWPRLQETYGSHLVSLDIFKTGTRDGLMRWEAFHSRVIEHNLRVIAKYYSRITLQRLTELLDLNLEETEACLSKLVVNKTIFARIDRPSGIVRFSPPQTTEDVLVQWTNDVNEILNLVEQTNHLIAKEEMLHKFKA